MFANLGSWILDRPGRRAQFFVVVALALAPAAPAPAVTLFVDQGDPQCSDVTGTPYCTINAAVFDAEDDDRVEVAAGTYGFESGDASAWSP